MERIRRSWQLAKASWAILRDDWSLLRFPVIGGVLSAILGALIALLAWGAGIFAGEGTGGEIVSYVGMFILYLATSFVVVYCNTALVSLVIARFNGESENADTGWAASRARWRQILGWSAIAATVGVILHVISGRGGRLGEIVAAIGAAAWALATFLVIPILVAEDIGPIEATKRSASLLRRTWGEQIAGNVGIGLVTGLFFIGVVVTAAALIGLASVTGVTVLIALAVLIAVIAIGFVIAISAAMNTIYRTAVYQYATGKPAIGFGEPELLKTAFAPTSNPAPSAAVV